MLPAGLDELRSDLLDAQFELSRGRSFSVIVIATGLVAAGRTEALAALRDWLDPKHITNYAWGKRDDAERARPWAYRYWQAMPRKGEIAVWFDGWYGDLVRVALDKSERAELRHRAKTVVALERMLSADGVRLLKWHFDIDAGMQRRRVKSLLADDLNRWRVSAEDRRNCKRHAQVARAHARCQSLTEHEDAPWQRFRDAYRDHQSPVLARSLLRVMTRSAPRPAPRPAPPRSKPPVASSSGAVKALKQLAAPTRAVDAGDAQALIKHQACFAHALQARRWRKRSLVIVLEGMDAAGKSSTTKRIIETMDPRRYRIVPISAPTPEEAAHPYQWRFWAGLPVRGGVSIFDRSWYGRVLVERVRRFSKPADWTRAYGEIVEFERQLAEHRILIAKFWFALSSKEQQMRFKARATSPLKRFKVDPEDWENRRHWRGFQAAAHDMIALTSSKHAPWTVIPADDKTHARAAVLRSLCDLLRE
jgi:polyphosphate kinase 2 (PPK2 family)